MEQSIAEYYIEKLNESTNPVEVLVGLYKTLFNIDNVDSSFYRVIARLYNIYGKEILFFSLLDCADIEEINFTSIARLISFFAKKRLESKYNIRTEANLQPLVEKVIKLRKKRRIKIPQPFEEEAR